ncbi:MAG: O-antigen ligase family protein [Candidatus Riflebacteria bacterium]|nr:O-antigen ligase family protein [Candidatus Riflebacteria bacterium]
MGAAIFLILLLPFVYFYDEALAVFCLELFSGVYFLSGFFNKNGKPFGKQKALLAVILFAWLFTVFRSVFISVSPDSSFPVFIKLSALIMIAFGLSVRFESFYKDTVNAIFVSSAVAGFIHGVIALFEYVEAPQIPPTWLDPSAKEIFRTRCAGIFTDPNIFASFLSVMFIFTLGYIFVAESKNNKNAGALSALLCGLAILTTLSRGAWISLGAGLFTGIVYIMMQKPRDREALKYPGRLIYILTAILLFIFLVGPFKYRFISIAKPSDMTFAQRTLINKAFVKHMGDFPIVGHGLHTFNQVYPRYRIVGGDYPMNAHNEFLHSLLETGFLSSILLFLLCCYIFKSLHLLRKTENIALPFFIAAFISLFVQNLSGFSSRILPTAALFSIVYAYVYASKYKTSNVDKKIGFMAKSAVMTFVIMYLSVSGYIYYIQKQIADSTYLLKQNKIEKSIEKLEQVSKISWRNSFVASLLGQLYMIKNNRAKAIEMYEYAAKINPSEASFYESLAVLNAPTDVEKSNKMYETALKLDPASENYRLRYAQFLLSQNKKEKAKKILEKGLEFSPGFHEVYTGFLKIESILNNL